ncbi:MAG: ELM1/GtrOC1 family putative glycosyltransferase [Gammaproteobacteria bacterium]
MSETRDSERGASRGVVVWWFRSHLSQYEDQTHGLLKALEARCPLRVYAAPVIGAGRLWRAFLRRRYPAANLPDPDILIGAGRETQRPMLAARRARGGRIVTLSNPSWPRWRFDLCIVPGHEGVRSSSRVIATRGLLAPPMTPRPKAQGTGLIVIGGPTLQYRWSEEELITQIAEIFSRHPDCRWYVTTTTQTPAETERRLQQLSGRNVLCIPHYEVDSKWLSNRLQDAEQVWLTEDNLSLIYQALTAEAAVGVLTLPRRKPSREVAALEGLVVFFPAWQAGTALHAPQPPFDESARCAAEIFQRWIGNAA